jgi:glutathione S-transferase
MSKIKLTYFDMDGGRAETTRIALSIAGIDFEDHRISFEEFGGLKNTFPLSSVPIIKIDGHTYTQSNAMSRYFGKKAGLYPEDAWQAFLCDEAMYIIDDLSLAIGKTMGLTGDELKTARESFVSGILTTALKLLSNRLEDAGGEYFAANQLTIADLVISGFLKVISIGMFEHVPSNVVEQSSPLLFKHLERVSQDPRVVSYYQKRSQ